MFEDLEDAESPDWANNEELKLINERLFNLEQLMKEMTMHLSSIATNTEKD